MAAGISAVVVLGTSSIFIDSTKLEAAQERQYWLAARRMEFQNLVRSQAGWNSVVTQNPAMNCFTDGTSCSAFASAQALKMPIDGSVLDGTSPSLGMSNKGDFCNQFDAVNGNSACPIGLSLEWVALCDDLNCKHAQPKLSFKFRAKDSGQALQSLKSYDLVVFKDPKLETLNEVCTAMGGELAGANCSIPLTACDPGNARGEGSTFPIGFSPDGAPICSKPNPGACASTDVATGFDVNGGILCEPSCR